jgi:small redox-active disulfide protein 2
MDKEIKIQVLGSGCPNCKQLEKNTNEALRQLNIDAEVIKITEISDIMSYGIMSTPALIINEKVATYGVIPSVEDIIKILTKND